SSGRRSRSVRSPTLRWGVWGTRRGRISARGRPLLAATFLQLLKDFIHIEGGRLLALRILFERREELAHVSLRGHQRENVIDEPVIVGVRGDVRPFVWVRPKIENLGDAQGDERLRPDAKCSRNPLLHEDELPVVVPQTGQLLVVVDVEERLSGTLVGLSSQVR